MTTRAFQYLLVLILLFHGPSHLAAEVSQQTTPPRQEAAYPESGLDFHTASDAVNRLRLLFISTLRANEKVFPGATGEVRGFGAGASYPQIWLRDSSTILPVARYLYQRPYLENDDGNLPVNLPHLDTVKEGIAASAKLWMVTDGIQKNVGVHEDAGSNRQIL